MLRAIRTDATRRGLRGTAAASPRVGDNGGEAVALVAIIDDATVVAPRVEVEECQASVDVDEAESVEEERERESTKSDIAAGLSTCARHSTGRAVGAALGGPALSEAVDEGDNGRIDAGVVAAEMGLAGVAGIGDASARSRSVGEGRATVSVSAMIGRQRGGDGDGWRGASRRGEVRRGAGASPEAGASLRGATR
jgi:hypothetical protein